MGGEAIILAGSGKFETPLFGSSRDAEEGAGGKALGGGKAQITLQMFRSRTEMCIPFPNDRYLMSKHERGEV